MTEKKYKDGQRKIVQSVFDTCNQAATVNKAMTTGSMVAPNRVRKLVKESAPLPLPLPLLPGAPGLVPVFEVPLGLALMSVL
jgi:hypothetical protein